MNRRKGARATERGAVAVEFALVLPVLMALLVGIVTAGLGYNRILGVADGVRGGARFGATTLSSGSWGSTVQTQTVALTSLNIPGHAAVVTPAMVCTQLVKAAGAVVSASTCATGVAAPADPAGVVAGTCLVKVWAKIPVTFDLAILGSYTAIVKRQSVTLYERTCT